MLAEYNLTTHNYLQLTSRAQYFVAATNISEIKKAIQHADKHKLTIYPLGSGSNIIVPEYVRGLVIYNCLLGTKVLKKSSNTVTLEVAAGEDWDKLVQYTIANNWYGLENLANIPGKVGAACVQNIGAYGVQLADYITDIEYLDYYSQKLVNLPLDKCKFGYRDSIFKQYLKQRAIITKVTFKLSRIFAANLAYQQVAQLVSCYPLNISGSADKLTAQDMYNLITKLRTQKLPDPQILPNLGSFFKNPFITHQQYTNLKSIYANIPSFKTSQINMTKTSAAWLIEQCGFKGYQENNVGISTQHSLVLTTCGSTTQAHVLALANKIIKEVQNKFAINLDIEAIVW